MMSSVSNPQLNPQNALICMTSAYFGSPRGVVSCCKTKSRYLSRQRPLIIPYGNGSIPASAQKGTKKAQSASRERRPSTLPIAIPGCYDVQRFSLLKVALLLLLLTKSDTTAVCAARFSVVTAWVYVSRVTRIVECRISSCITLSSAPVARSSVEYVLRKVCHPILSDAKLLCNGADVTTKKLLSPIRVPSSTLGTGEHPTLRCSIGRSVMPAPQSTDQMIVKWHWFL